MKKTVSFVLALCLFMSLLIPVNAEESILEAPIVSSLEELQAALSTAEDGDTIYIAASISIVDESFECDKDITLARAEGFGRSLFVLYGGTIRGLSFSESTEYGCTLEVKATEGETLIQDCNFCYNGKGTASFIEVTGGLWSDTYAAIRNCSFSGATNSAISSKGGTFVTVDTCQFDKNSSSMSGGAISAAGAMDILNSSFADGSATSGGAVFGNGDLTITNCQFENNTTTNPRFGSDIFSMGTLSIADEPEENAGYYEETTGEKIALPLLGYTRTAKLIHLSTEQAEEYFAPIPTSTPEPTQPPEPDPTATSTPDAEGQPTQEPTPFPSNPTSTPQSTAAPTQPPQDNAPYPTLRPSKPNTPTPTPQAPTPTPEATERPQKPIDGGNSEVAPTASPCPTQQPTTPVSPTPVPSTEPEPKPSLVCGDAVIDTARTVVLRGYGDGNPHEDDPLTRAQLATIIYRLLDDESIAKYGSKISTFTDVPDNAWYTEYVSTINRAGIVCGVGDDRYSPNSYVTWAQIITVLTRFVEPQECTLKNISYSGWADQAIQTAVALGWIEDSAAFKPHDAISRGELVRLVNGVLVRYR